MKNIKNLFLALSILAGSTTWLEAWRCTGCNQNRRDNVEQPLSFCQDIGHQYCAPCAANYNANECPQCIRQNPNDGNIETAINNELQHGIRCHSCRNLFNDADHFAINPEPCHHRICVSCAYTLLQNRGYSQRTANFVNRRNAPRYDEGFNNNVFVGRHGRRFEHRHRNVLHDNVVHERSHTHHYIAAQCPVPNCDRAFSQATCNAVHTEYNNRAISFRQYLWRNLGRDDNERIVSSVLIGGILAVYAAIIYKAYKEDKKEKKWQQQQIKLRAQQVNNQNKQRQ